MNNLPLYRDLINIVRKYLTISKYQVKRNYKLVICNIGTLLSSRYNNYIYCYCPFCDEIEECYKNHNYMLDIHFSSYKRNTKYIFPTNQQDQMKNKIYKDNNNYYPCKKCYIICMKKFKILKKIKEKV